ncbi:hypothetical protein [Nonomuraea indica]|uniref:hypothetical protein n=1 Tax=Nonomuraea indica TaxID=1581193 RepID=UPI000C7A54BD|nr:hypothetical protein [Nonomuraea indica]
MSKKRKGFDDLIARREELGDVSPPWVTESVEEPHPQELVVQTASTAATATSLPNPDTVPAPYSNEAAGELSEQERADLATCEAALDGLRLAWWAAGKALQTIRDARLYRADYPSFEEYCTDRWDMSRRQADRLIAAWPLAEQLRPIGLATINEGQVRELLPVAERHGQDAAVTVYRTVLEADGVKVTAALLKGAAGVIANSEQFDPVQAAAQIRAYLTGEAKPGAPTDPGEAFTAETERLRAVLTRTVKRPAFLTYARTHPEQARAVVAELRALLDDIEQAATAAEGPE